MAADLDFDNDPEEIARHFDRFIGRQAQSFEVRAVYTETNGFDINPDCWFFDVFAHDHYGGHEDYDWLSDWQSGPFAQMRLTGMETLQGIYASDAFTLPENRDPSGISSLYVVVRFQALIQRSAPFMRELRCPLLATSHDYDLFYEYKRSALDQNAKTERNGPVIRKPWWKFW